MSKKLWIALGAFALGVGAGVGLATFWKEKRKYRPTCDEDGEEEAQIALEADFADVSVKECEVERGARVIRETLVELALCEKCEITSVMGPSVICYRVVCSPAGGAAEAAQHVNDLSLNLGRVSRLVPCADATDTFLLEVPREKRETVAYAELENTSKKLLEVPIGKGVDGETVYCDLAKMPNLLVAGMTGTGKSVLTETVLAALAEKNAPADVRFVLIDPKMIEFAAFETLPHLHAPILTSVRDAAAALHILVEEMERRYALMREARVRSIGRYNETAGKVPEKHLPVIVVAVDELTDLFVSGYGELIEPLLLRLAQKSRAAGIHLILSAQRIPDVITPTLKANMPSRVAFALRRAEDSRGILDMSGAESLMAHGDMLYMPMGEVTPRRVQCAYLSDREVQERVSALREAMPDVTYDGDFVRRMHEQSMALEAAGFKDEDPDGYFN